MYVNFNYYVNLSEIDEYIASTLQYYIGIFERKLKAFIGEYYSKKMYDLGDKTSSNYSVFIRYINKDNVLGVLNVDEDYDKYGNIVKRNSYNRTKALNDMIKTSSGLNHTTFILKHYIHKGYVPFWVIVHSLTMSELIHLFMMIPLKERIEFVRLLQIKENPGLKEALNFSRKMQGSRVMRNIVNHYEPIIPFILNYKKNEMSTLFETIKILTKKTPKRYSIDKPILIVNFNSFNKIGLDLIRKILSLI